MAEFVRKTFPSETPALTSLGQVPAKTDIDETLKPTESLAGIRVPEVVRPPRHYRIHHIHEFLRADRCSSRRYVLQAVPNLLLSRLRWENVDGILAAPRTPPFHEVEADEIESLGHTRHVSLVAVESQVHPRGDRLQCGDNGLGTSAAYQNGIVGVAVQCRTQLLRVASPMPQLIEEVQVDVTVQWRDR